MSWIALQTKWRAPTHPGGTITEPIYTNKDTGYVRYRWNGISTISLPTKMGYSLLINGVELLPIQISYNGYIGFVGGAYKAWYHHWYGWVVVNYLQYPIFCPLLEYWDISDWDDASVGTYLGMAFYSFSAPPALGDSVIAYGRGILRGSVYGGTPTTTLTIETKWERWQTDAPTTLYGKHSPLGTATEDKYFGSPQWKNGTTKYCRTPTAVSGKFDYGDIAWNDDAGKYILGSYNSLSGWHESSSAPIVESSWTLDFEKPEGSEVEGDDITLEWDDWMLGTYTKNIHAMRANKWVG